MAIRVAPPTLGRARLGLYFLFWAFSFITFCLTIARVHYTTNLSRHDPLNGGHPFFDSVVVYLMVCTLLSFFFIPVVLGILDFTTWIDKYVQGITNAQLEITALSLLTFMWFIAVVVNSNTFGNLSFCDLRFSACSVLTALEVFSWLAWVLLLLLLLLRITMAVIARRDMSGTTGTEAAYGGYVAEGGQTAEKDLPAAPRQQQTQSWVSQREPQPVLDADPERQTWASQYSQPETPRLAYAA